MTLKLGPTPPAAKALVLKELESRLSAREFIPALQGAAKLSNGVPFYRISYAGLKRLKPIASCKAVGWCFLLAGGAEPATAVVGKERSQWHFRGMGARDFALRFISAVRKAEASYAKGPSFELRSLRRHRHITMQCGCMLPAAAANFSRFRRLVVDDWAMQSAKPSSTSS